MIRKLKFFALILIVVSMSTCEIDRCLQSAGDQTTQIFEYDTFGVVDINGVFDVELVQDTCYYLEVICGENIQKHIELDFESDTLEVIDYNKCGWYKGYSRTMVKIHFNDIRTIRLVEASNVFSKEPVTDRFQLIVMARMAEVDLLLDSKDFFFYNHRSTGGVYKFSGFTEYARLSGYYNTVIDASELRAERLRINNYSVVDFKVWAEESLSVGLYNSGNVFYKGDPDIEIDTIASTGRLLQLQE